ncbi:MAG: protein-tyrosine phosphatase family protein [Endozoicomonas sp.]
MGPEKPPKPTATVRPAGFAPVKPACVPHEESEDESESSPVRRATGEKTIPEAEPASEEGRFLSDRGIVSSSPLGTPATSGEDDETGESEARPVPPRDPHEYVKSLDELRVKNWVADTVFRLPAENFPKAVFQLYTVAWDSTRLKTASLLPGSDLQCSVYRISGGSLMAAACQAPCGDDAEQFWSIVCRNDITHVVNINPAGVAEDYYPEGEQFSLNLGLFQIRQKLPPRGQPLEEPPASKRPRLEPESEDTPVSRSKLRVVYTDQAGRKQKHRVRMLRVRDWPDGHGYEPKALVRIARKLTGGRTLVHSQAGLGRTGTLVVTMQLVDLFDRNQLPREEAVEVLVKLILKDRKNRGDRQFVTTVEQFECLIRVVKHLFSFPESELMQQVNRYLVLPPED